MFRRPELRADSFRHIYVYIYTALLPHYGYSGLLLPTQTLGKGEIRSEASQELCSTEDHDLLGEGTRSPCQTKLAFWD